MNRTFNDHSIDQSQFSVFDKNLLQNAEYVFVDRINSTIFASMPGQHELNINYAA